MVRENMNRGKNQRTRPPLPAGPLHIRRPPRTTSARVGSGAIRLVRWGAAPNSPFWLHGKPRFGTPTTRVGSGAIRLVRKSEEPRAKSKDTASLARWAATQQKALQNDTAPTCYVLFCEMQERSHAPTWENLRTWCLLSNAITFIRENSNMKNRVWLS